MPLALPRLFPFVLGLSMISVGCGTSSTSAPPPPAAPMFTSVPVTSAAEGVLYSYQLTATSPDMSSVTFALTSGPTGASLSGSTVSWTPTHNQSRTANPFSVTATNAKGGSATQSWSVTPDGTIVITGVITYWTPTGTVEVPRVWLTGQPYPAALVPQADGTIIRLLGVTNPDGTFSIPNVPGGFYWLQLSQAQTYWTSTSSFDAGLDEVGNPLAQTTQSTTTINYSLTGLDPIQSQDVYPIQSNARGFELGFIGGGLPGTTTLNFGEKVTSNIDFSSVNTIFFSQMEPLPSGTFSGLALGTSLTLSNVSIIDGGVNNISGTLTRSPQSSIPLNIKGSAWADNYLNSAPATVTPLLTGFSVSVQPFVTDRIAGGLTNFIGPNLTLLVPSALQAATSLLPAYVCQETSGPLLQLQSNSMPPVILNDQDFGVTSYGDPYPASWPRVFQICQHATVQLPRPNSTLSDTFLLTNGETTSLPTAPIAPLVGPVQNPIINGTNIFQPAPLNTTTVSLTWSAPTGAQPFGYYVTVFQLLTLPTGAMQYASVARFGTAQTSMAVPLLATGNTYVIQIMAVVDGIANMQTSPFRSRLPIAYSTVLSAPITIN
jgi:hypothetical protein